MNQKKLVLIILIVSIVGALCWLVFFKTETGLGEKATADREIDLDGDFFIYLKTEQLYQFLFELLANLQTSDHSVKENEEREIQFLKKVFDLFGFDQLKAFAASLKAIDKNFSRAKIYFYLRPGKRETPLWDFIDQKNETFQFLDFLPSSTVLSFYAWINPQIIWDHLMYGAGEIFPDVKKQLKKRATAFEASLAIAGFDLKKIFAALRTGAGFLITVDPKKEIFLPIGTSAIKIGEPAIAIILEKKDNYLFNLIKDKFGGYLYYSEDLQGKKLKAPKIELPFSFQPVILDTGKYLLAVSNEQLLEAILNTYRKKSEGLIAANGFRRLLANLPNKGSGFGYVGAKFWQTYLQIMKAVGNDNEQRTISEDFLNLFNYYQQMESASVINREKDGLSVLSCFNWPPEKAILLPLVNNLLIFLEFYATHQNFLPDEPFSQKKKPSNL